MKQLIIRLTLMVTSTACSPQRAGIRTEGEGCALYIDGSCTYIRGTEGTNQPDVASGIGKPHAHGQCCDHTDAVWRGPMGARRVTIVLCVHQEWHKVHINHKYHRAGHLII